jgi:hypothetical protein
MRKKNLEENCIECALVYTFNSANEAGGKKLVRIMLI